MAEKKPASSAAIAADKQLAEQFEQIGASNGRRVKSAVSTRGNSKWA
jgi:hypothetical protein